MALQLRRGTNANRLTITPAQGEPVYNTDTKTLYIGDGVTAGGNPVSPVTTVNGLTGNVSLTTDTVGEGSHNQYFTTTRAIDAVGTALAGGTLTGIAISYNSTTHAITITNTVSVASGAAGALGYYSRTGTALVGTQSLQWNESTNTQTIINGQFLNQQNVTGVSAISLEAFNTATGSAGGGTLALRRAHGYNLGPAAVTNTDYLYNILFQGHDGTGFQNVAGISASVSGGVTTGIVPGLLQFFVTDTSGSYQPRAAILSSGIFTIGPSATTQGGSGALSIRQTTSAFGNPAIVSRTYFSDQYGSAISLRKYRGSYASPTAVLLGDQIGAITTRAYDGANLQGTGSIQFLVDAAPSANIIPGNISFFTSNSAGIETLAAKIDSSQQLTTYGNVTVNGTLTVNGTTVTTNATSVSVEDKLMKLGRLTNSSVSATGEIGSITGTGPWTATISGMTSTVDLIVGSSITATGSGSTGTITVTAASTSTANCTGGAINGTQFTLSGNITGSFVIGMQLSGGNVAPGTYIVSGSGANWVVNNSQTVSSETITGTLNVLTANSTASLIPGSTLTLASSFGGLSTSTTYYVTYIASSTQFSLSSSFGGNNFTLTTATGSVTATYGSGSLGSGGTYIVASIPSSTSITFTATGGTTPVAGPVTNIATSGATDITASGGGVLVYGTSNKSITWSATTTTGGTNTGYWNSTDNLNLGGTSLGYYINGTGVLTTSSVLANATTITVGAAGATENIGASTGNSTLNIYGNGTSGTAAITTNVTTGTANLFAGVTGNINFGGITWTGSGNSALIVSNGGLQFSSASSVAAAGTNQGTATQLYADNNFITSGTGGVVLPAATTGREVSVTNNTGASINVYPQGTHTIESGSAGVPTVLPNLATISLMAKSGNNWWTIQPVYNGGTGVSITQSANGTVTWNIGQAVSTTSNVTFANVQTTGLTLRNVNFIAVASTATYALSTTTSYNVLVVSNTGLTVTVTMPPSPVDQQLCSFTIASNTISTLNMTAGPTIIPPFTGTSNVTSGTVYQYVYRASTTTWYRN